MLKKEIEKVVTEIERENEKESGKGNENVIERGTIEIIETEVKSKT